MLDVDDLYREVLLDHSRRPRNRRRLETPTHTAEGFNPLCGDQIEFYLSVDGTTVVEVGFESRGCAISTASASMMTESIKGKSTGEVDAMFHAFHRMVTGETSEDGDEDVLGDLDMLGGVSAYPVRIKCAVLPWHTLQAALAQKEGAVSTE